MKKLKETKNLIYILIGLVIVLIAILVLFLNKKDINIGTSPNALKCNRENTLLEGFHNKEEVI
ncbi:MAG: LPXTG cell wall anchor domain-containing protein, partial [Bacilli bacterium]|nr:LPXTG cell wall anchor domain-containing protein [Bacilli bacterium]